MRIGVLNCWLGGRYLPFWVPYLRALEVEVVEPSEQTAELNLPGPVRRVLGQAFSVKDQGVDFILVPDPQLGVEPRRGTPSPWLLDLGATLNRLIPGLPPVLSVPGELSPEVAGLAAEVGQALTGNPMSARRALERTRTLLHPEYKPPKQGGAALVGLVAQPVVLDDPGVLAAWRSALEPHGLSPFVADKAPPALRDEGQKLELPLELPTDLEAAGMHRYLTRLGKVKAVAYLHDPEYAPLPNPLRKLVRKGDPGKPWALADLGDPAEAAFELAKALAI